MSAMLPDWLTHRARGLPRVTAIATARRQGLSYAALYEYAVRQAHALAAVGVGPGERVAVIAGTSSDFVVAMHATTLIDAIFVPLNVRLTAPELAEQLCNAEPAVVLCDLRREELALEAAALAGLSRPFRMPLQTVGEKAQIVEAHDSERCHSIVYTSGTAGNAKGVALTYGNFWASASASALNLGLDPSDRWLACLPLNHVGGLSIPIRSAIYGTTVELHSHFSPKVINMAVRSGEVTLLSVVPTMLRRMLNADDRSFGSSLRAVLVGGGPVSPVLLERATERGLPVVQTYGLTEACSQVTTLAPSEAMSHLGSAGRALLSAEVRVDASVGEAGEILIRGPAVTTGYYRNPEATDAAFSDGWLQTGDIGFLDKDGFLTVLDRRDDVIVSGGENVYPAEVEAALLAYPGIEAAAVVGISDDEWGQRVVAAVVSQLPVELDRLEPLLRSRLAGYKIPVAIERFDALPVTSSGKVQRRFVRQQMAKRLAKLPANK